MRIRKISASAIALMVCTNFASADGLWRPSDFEGVYVKLFDDATNGCWTNIREIQAYTEDQLELAGFAIIEEPKTEKGSLHPLLEENIAEYRLHVKASRWDSGMCVGYLNSSFWASVAPGYDQSKLIVGQIGNPYVWTVWNNKNLNEYLFDQVKLTIKSWVEIGETPLHASD